MDKSTLLLIPVILLAVTSAGMIISGILFKLHLKRKIRSCTGQTQGKVIKYKYLNERVISPMVEYSVNGETFVSRKKFQGIKSSSITGLPNAVEPDMYEDEEGYLHIKSGSFLPAKALAEKLWPIGSTLDVHYNPDQPKMNYVGKPITKHLYIPVSIIIGITGIALAIVIGVLVL